MKSVCNLLLFTVFGLLAGCRERPAPPTIKQADLASEQPPAVDQRKLLELELQLQELKAKSDKTLTRDKALLMLLANKMNPIDEVYGGLGACELKKPLTTENKFLFEAAKRGLIKTWPAPRQGPTAISGAQSIGDTEPPGPNTPFLINVNLYATLTAEGKLYCVRHDKTSDTFRMAELEPFAVTGVGAPSQMLGTTVSVVRFLYSYKATPFGLAFNAASGESSFSGRVAGVAKFVLYDDGWRLEGWERDNGPVPQLDSNPKPFVKAKFPVLGWKRKDIEAIFGAPKFKEGQDFCVYEFSNQESTEQPFMILATYENDSAVKIGYKANKYAPLPLAQMYNIMIANSDGYQWDLNHVEMKEEGEYREWGRVDNKATAVFQPHRHPAMRCLTVTYTK